MKRLIYIVSIALLLALNPACEKDSDNSNNPDITEELLPDYREEWVGDYVLENTCINWNPSGNSTTTTTMDTVGVTIVQNTADSIKVYQWQFSIGENGHYKSQYQHGHTYLNIRLFNDSLYIKRRAGGMGGGFRCEGVGPKL